ncbi:regulator of G-protein signaling 20-like [Sinocyclocheilus rhinocerous]|uniref:Regulator of G-protein signaling 20-like n=1 Tax=Sinocyclocheilus rhinocerous TaxID=307959 RepID=A0A673G059_9TELE|nr:PREDICTED: regulator of G-protein signaling 20-like [Sinocyclocheilus rhinocerous]
MASELEMGKCPPQNAGNATQVQNTPPNTHILGSVNTQTVGLFNSPSNACCFCWCCCCSCSCLTVRSAKEEKNLTTISENEEDVDTNQMPQLTLEEVHTWGESFERLIKSAQGRVHFRQFLKTEFSEENLMFWLACEDLNKETNKTMVEQTVKQIYEDYVSVLSPKEVSLDSHAREVINRNMLEPSSCTFDEAQQQIYKLMQRDSYPRYMNSSMYADLIQSLEQVNES